MSIDWVEASVTPRIPAECVTHIESWLLTRIFKTETKNDWLGFYGNWSFNEFLDELLPDDELNRALVVSSEMSPELCSEVQHEINKSGHIILGAVNYAKIFQAIIRRNSSFPQHVSILELERNTRVLDYGETFRLITPDAIETISTRRWPRKDIIRLSQDANTPFIRCRHHVMPRHD
jgi:hypothetical protein